MQKPASALVAGLTLASVRLEGNKLAALPTNTIDSRAVIRTRAAMFFSDRSDQFRSPDSNCREPIINDARPIRYNAPIWSVTWPV